MLLGHFSIWMGNKFLSGYFKLVMGPVSHLVALWRNIAQIASCIISASITVLLCNSKSPVVYSGPILWNRQLILAKKRVALPSKNGVVTKAAENGVAVWKKDHLPKKKKKQEWGTDAELLL